MKVAPVIGGALLVLWGLFPTPDDAVTAYGAGAGFTAVGLSLIAYGLTDGEKK